MIGPLSIETSWVVFVWPAVGPTEQTLLRANELITDDFPTFGKPTTAHVTPVLIPFRRLYPPRTAVSSSAPYAVDPDAA